MTKLHRFIPFSGQCQILLRRGRFPLLFAFLILLTPLFSRVANAQSGEITGIVSDPSGAVVANAHVTITSLETGNTHSTVANGAGIFDFPSLNVGDYNLAVSAPGFETYKKTGIVMNAAETLKEDVSLAVGGGSQTVTVEADALQTQSESNEVSTLITGQQVVQLATNGRNITSLTTLGTGVSTNMPSFNGVAAQTSNASISFNGMRPGHNNWLIDGGEVYDRGSGGKLGVQPAPDVIDQFQVLSSNYTPDYGIASGGSILMELKSGTRAFHGGLWEFIRNDALDANSYFNKQANQPSPELRLNIFGGDIGGPLFIPHFYNNARQKTFFFWSEEWRKYIQGANASTQNTIPASDFPTAGSAFAYTPFNKSTPIVPNLPNNAAYTALELADGLTPGSPFPNNTVPANMLDPNALLFMSTGAIPHPDVPGENEYVASPKQPTYVREDVVRIDHNITDKLHLLGSYIHDQMSQTEFPDQWGSDTYTTVGEVFANPSWATVVKLSQTLSPTLLNETAFNVNGNTINITNAGISAEPAGWSAQSFFTGNNAGNRLPQVQFQGGPLTTTWGSNYYPWHNSYLNYQLRDDLSWIKGRHTFKFGVSYMRADKNQQQQADTQGDYTFTNTAASQDAYLNFLLGLANSYQQLQSMITDHWINNNYSFYLNDDWHASSRLTLNLGLRYDALPHVYEKNNQIAVFNPADFNPANAQSPNASTGDLNPAGPGFSQPSGAPVPFYLNGIEMAGVNGAPRGLVKNDYFTIEPRLGFAYDVFGNGKTVVRGGAGMFYERVQGNDTYNSDTTPPFSYQPSASQVFFSNPNQNYLTGASATSPVAPAGLTSLSNYYPNPATFQYSVGVQHELAPSVVMGVQYVGTSGWNQSDTRAINDLSMSALADRQIVAGGGNANLYRPYQGFAGIAQEENASNSSYNSLQAALRVEKRHGLTMQFAYTWSHEIDRESDDLSTDVSNPYDLNYDKGSGTYDRRNIFNANFVYDLPFLLHGGNYAAREVLGGWQVSGVMVAESGLPQDITYGTDVLGLGGNTNNRPNISGIIAYPRTQKEWFDTSVFTAPAAPWTTAGAGGTGFGNARKDAIVQPGLFNWNLSLYKDIPIHESIHMQFRAESFNTFNHTEWNGIDGGFNDGNFGQTNGTYDPRELQFGLKLLF
jgi:hypothetical protein